MLRGTMVLCEALCALGLVLACPLVSTAGAPYPGMPKTLPWDMSPKYPPAPAPAAPAAAPTPAPPPRWSVRQPSVSVVVIEPPQTPRLFQILVAPQQEQTSPGDAATAELAVQVPSGSDLWFGGVHLPRKNAVRRELVTPPLEPGRLYAYDVRVDWTEAGSRVEQRLKVRVAAGDRLHLALRSVQEVQAEVRANLARLGDDDRKLAEEQVYCALEEANPLGALGVPVKVMLNGQPVFVSGKQFGARAELNPELIQARARQFKVNRADVFGR